MFLCSLAAGAGAANGVVAATLLAPFYGVTIATAANGDARHRWLPAATLATLRGTLRVAVVAAIFGALSLLIGGSFHDGLIVGAFLGAFGALTCCVGHTCTPPVDVPHFRV